MRAVDPDTAEDAASEDTGLEHPPDEAVARARQELLEEAAQPIAANPAFRQHLIEIRRSYEQTIDTVSQDQLVKARYSADAADRARTVVQSFEQFVRDHRDEITALQVLYSRPYRQRLSYQDIKGLADTLRVPPLALTPERLWDAYQQLDRSRVRGSGQRVMADIVSLVRFAIGENTQLAPFAEHVAERFEGWLATQELGGRTFSSEQRRWLEAIRDHIAGSVSIGPGDFELAPFDQRGGLGRAHSLFGNELEALLDELNRELVA